MDFKFPKLKDTKKRYCFQCQKEINFGEYFIKNRTMDNLKLLKLWDNKCIEFYCCLCYDNMIRYKEKEEKIKNVDLLELDIIKIIEKRYHIDIPLVNELKYNTIGFIIENNKISELQLFHCIDQFPEEICSLSGLEKLHLPWNRLKMMPNSIGKLVSLKELDLIGNYLSNLPQEIGSLSSLNELDLSYNGLISVPEALGNLKNLKRLNFIQNKIVNLPDSLINLEYKGLQILL